MLKTYIVSFMFYPGSKSGVSLPIVQGVRCTRSQQCSGRRTVDPERRSRHFFEIAYSQKSARVMFAQVRFTGYSRLCPKYVGTSPFITKYVISSKIVQQMF